MTNKDIECVQSALRAVRYMVAWEGDPKKPTHKKMPDGYWVPWHVADLFLAGLKDDEIGQNVERDEALLQQALNALEYHSEQTRPIQETNAAIDSIRERLMPNAKLSMRRLE